MKCEKTANFYIYKEVQKTSKFTFYKFSYIPKIFQNDPKEKMLVVISSTSSKLPFDVCWIWFKIDVFKVVVKY